MTHPQSTPSRLQFVKLCECGCGQPTLLAPSTYHGWGWVKGVPLRFLHNHHMKGERNNHWVGGKWQDQGGYWWVNRPDHPYAKGGKVQEHRLVVEARLGRYLQSHEIVHHKDEDPSNNADSNLILTDRPNHARIHGTARGWSRKYLCCLDCGTTDKANKPHVAHGYCNVCYMRRWHQAHVA